MTTCQEDLRPVLAALRAERVSRPEAPLAEHQTPPQAEVVEAEQVVQSLVPPALRHQMRCYCEAAGALSKTS